MSEKNTFEFYKLSPNYLDTSTDSYKVCKDALDSAYNDADVTNIAITGIYGSGKTSFLKTYYKNSYSKEIIKVAITDFQNTVDNNRPDQSQRIKIAERQIINQILYQIPYWKIPLSKFQVKEKRSLWVTSLLSVAIVAFLIGICSQLDQNKHLTFIYKDLFKITNYVFWANFTAFLCLLLPFVALSIWLARRINIKLTKFNFKGTESELIENDDTELLDQEAREIVYLILASEVETVIFEDLDRFNDISIFVRLREINSLVNQKSKVEIRFVYVIRDGLFKSKDRTKFFDLIIPIIPCVTSFSSVGKIYELFDNLILKEGSKGLIRPSVLKQLSIYIDDMRLLYSIRNEYEIYIRSIDATVYANEILALIVLKNVFPEEFEELENDKGYLYGILNKRDTLFEIYSNSIHEKLRQSENLKKFFVDQFTDFIAIHIPKDTVFPEQNNNSLASYIWDWSKNPTKQQLVRFDNSYRSTNYTFDQFIDELEKRKPNCQSNLQILNRKNIRDRVEEIEIEIILLQDSYSKKMIAKTSELLNELSEDELSDFFEEGKHPITEDHYYPLIRYLVTSGLLDENYRQYKGYFHAGSISKNDYTYISLVLSGMRMNNNYKLDNPEMVMEYFNEHDYSRQGIVNYSLIDELLKNNRSHELYKILKVIFDRNDFDALFHIHSFDYAKFKKLVKLTLELGFEKVWDLCNHYDIFDKILIKIVAIICEISSIYEVIRKTVNDEFKQLVANRADLLELEFIKNKSAMLDGIESMEIQFVDVSNLDISSELAQQLIERSLFVISLENVLNLLYLYIKIDNININKIDILKYLFGHLFSNKELEKLRDDIEENLDEFIEKYLLIVKKQQIQVRSGEVAFIEILNSDIAQDLKRRMIEAESTKINDLSEVRDNELLDDLYANDLVTYNKVNIVNYYKRVKASQILVSQINNNYVGEFTLPPTMSTELLNNPFTSIGIFGALIANALKNEEGAIEILDDDLDNQKYRVLVENGLILLTIENFKILLNTNDDEIIIHYLKQNSIDIVDFMSENDLIKDLSRQTVIEIIDRNVLNHEDMVRFLQEYGKVISLYSVSNAELEVRKFIFNFLFDDSDYEDIIRERTDFDLWGELISNLNHDGNKVGILKKEMDAEFITEIIKDKNLKLAHKVKILVKVIKEKNFVQNWERWISSIEEIKKVALVFEGRRPLVQNEGEQMLSDALVEIGIVNVWRNGRLNLDRKKYEELKGK